MSRLSDLPVFAASSESSSPADEEWGLNRPLSDETPEERDASSRLSTTIPGARPQARPIRSFAMQERWTSLQNLSRKIKEAEERRSQSAGIFRAGVPADGTGGNKSVNGGLPVLSERSASGASRETRTVIPDGVARELYRIEGTVEASLPPVVARTLYILGLRRDIKSRWYKAWQAIRYFIIEVIVFASVFTRLIDTYDVYRNWLFPVFLLLAFGAIVAVTFLWGMTRTDVFWSMFVHVQRLPYDVRCEIMNDLQHKTKLMWPTVLISVGGMVVSSIWSWVVSWDRLTAFETLSFSIAILVVTPLATANMVTILWLTYAKIQVAVHDWAEEHLRGRDVSPATTRLYQMIRDDYIKSRRQWMIVVALYILVCVSLLGYYVLALAAGAFSEVVEGRPFAHDILFICFAPVTASQLLIQYLYGLIRINRKVSATWSDVAVSR